MIFFLYWPAGLSWFFVSIAVIFLILLGGYALARGRNRAIISMLINGVSVVSFFAFLFSILRPLILECNTQNIQTIVLALALFIVLIGAVYLFMGRIKK